MVPDGRIASDLRLRGIRLRAHRLEPAAPSAGAPRPTVVLLHDSLGSIRQWRDLPERLRDATGCPVLAYDRQGYGESDPVTSMRRAKTYLEAEAAVLEDVLEACGTGSAILVGHSDGGTIALLAAARAGEAAGKAGGMSSKPRIAGIVVEAGHVAIEPITVKGIGDALEAWRTTDLKERLARYHGDKAEALMRMWAESWLSEEFQAWNITGRLPSIQCPTLVIQGTEDNYATLAQVDAVMRAVKGPAQQLVLPGIGHTPHREAPGEVLTAMAEFIRAIPSE